ncbi:MAG: sugar phosphate isomerase/epimerase family protein [Chloroflexota bacterium]
MNQFTTLEQWSLREAIEGYARHGIKGIAIVRDKLKEIGASEAARLLRDHDMTVTGYCIGGLLTDVDDRKFQASLDDNKRVIDEAAEIQAACVTFVAGGLTDDSKDIEAARDRCLEGLQILLPYVKQAGIVLGLEPLHPMTSAYRSCLTTLRLANDWFEQLGGGSELGIVLDVYHVWWEPNLAEQIARATGRIVAFHVSDWLADTQDIRLDRGMMGDGQIDIPGIRKLVEATGYTGYNEVEIFSARNWWQRDPDEVIEVTKERYLQFV